jgi:predicted nucleic acid-binding Zn ribbon protein
MKNLGAILPDFLRRIASDNDIALIFLTELWPQIVGKEMAANSRPLSLGRKKLRVTVPSEVWQSELTGLEATFVSNINNYWRLSLVERIQFTVDSFDQS